LTNVYIDGFNLYYVCLRKTSYKWLDVHKLAQLTLPGDTINQIKYFTARVSDRPNDPGVANRQDMYLRALKTLPNVTIIEGHFRSDVVKMRLETPLADGTTSLPVIKTEEKGSDVNIAVHLLHDAHLKRYEQGIVISNDSDLAEAIRLARVELKIKIGVFNPKPQRCNKDLRIAASFHSHLVEENLMNSQFPSQLTDAIGAIHKPSSW